MSLSPQALLARAMAADPRFESLAEVGRILGLTRERVRQLVPAPTGRNRVGRPREGELLCNPDLRRARELVVLGMTKAEAIELLGYSTGRVTRRAVGARPRAGKVRDGSGWRSWRVRIEREIGKLIAADALRQGATLREAGAVSGLNWRSIGAWCSRGELPRSRNSQGRHPR